MAQNLNYYTPAGSAHYNYDSITYSNIYGRLYSWTIANQTCPSGWHLSTHDDWKKLENYLGVSSSEYMGIGEHYYIGTNQGGILKDIVLWKLPNTGAQNSVGFSVIPAGLIRELVTSNKNY
jgi:uncharacterized protein (TIGR02145 family)